MCLTANGFRRACVNWSWESFKCAPHSFANIRVQLLQRVSFSQNFVYTVSILYDTNCLIVQDLGYFGLGFSDTWFDCTLVYLWLMNWGFLHVRSAFAEMTFRNRHFADVLIVVLFLPRFIFQLVWGTRSENVFSLSIAFLAYSGRG